MTNDIWIERFGERPVSVGYQYMETGDGLVRYPEHLPFSVRNPGDYASDELMAVIIRDIWEILDVAEITGSSNTAWELVQGAASLMSNPDGFLSDLESVELGFILEQAESLEGIMIEWNSETVTITLADGWEIVPDGENP
jgi:hypothetical protein